MNLPNNKLTNEIDRMLIENNIRLLPDNDVQSLRKDIATLIHQAEITAVREDRLYNARFYKEKIDKLFDSEIQVYTEALEKEIV